MLRVLPGGREVMEGFEQIIRGWNLSAERKRSSRYLYALSYVAQHAHMRGGGHIGPGPEGCPDDGCRMAAEAMAPTPVPEVA